MKNNTCDGRAPARRMASLKEAIMGASRNQESTRCEQSGVTYYDRGILTGKDGRRYQRYAIKTHFVQPGEDQAELVRRYVLPLYQPGD